MIYRSSCLEHLLLVVILILWSASSDLISFGVSMQNRSRFIGLQLNYGNYSFHCNSFYHNEQYLCAVNDTSTLECNHTHYVASNGWDSLMVYNMNISTSFLIQQIILHGNGNNKHITDSLHIHLNNSNYSITSIDSDLGTNTQYKYIAMQTFSSLDGIIISLIDNLTLWNNVYPPHAIPKIINTNNTDPCYRIKVLSFGFRVTPEMVHNADVLLTLYWFDQILNCSIPKPDPECNISTETDFMCNQSNILLVTTNSAYVEYKMHLYYDHSHVFGPSSVFLTDLFGNRFDIRFCGATRLSDDNNSNEQCPAASDGIYLHRNLKMSNTSRHMKQVYVELGSQILDHSNQYSIGLISSDVSIPTPIPTPHLTKVEGPDLDSIDYLAVSVVSFFVILVLCITLIGCTCYVRILQKRLKEYTQQQTTSNKKEDDASDSDRITDLVELTPLNTDADWTRDGASPDAGRPSLLPVNFSSIRLQPGALGNKSTTESRYLSRSTFTDPSQNREGYQKPTKVDSAVHLEIIQCSEDPDKDSDADVDAEWDPNEENTLLNEMLDDVMRMNSVECMSIQKTDSDDSDDMYDTTHHITVTPNVQDISIMVENEHESDGSGHSENESSIYSNDDDEKREIEVTKQ
eukprot:430632_1